MVFLFCGGTCLPNRRGGGGRRSTARTGGGGGRRDALLPIRGGEGGGGGGGVDLYDDDVDIDGGGDRGTIISGATAAGLELEGLGGGGARDRSRRRHQPNPPRYRRVNRSSCALLEACWNQNWDDVVARISGDGNGSGRRRHRRCDEAFCETNPGGRTALHLATMPGASCPRDVLRAVLEANPHAVLRNDRHRHGGTPLHFLCGSRHRADPGLVGAFVDAAVEQERKYAGGGGGGETTVRVDGYSPLFMACRKGDVPPETLQVLVDSRRRSPSSWISPWTGGESAELVLRRQRNRAPGTSHTGYLSPLLELWNKVSDNFRCIDGDDDERAATILRQMRVLAILVLESDREGALPAVASVVAEGGGGAASASAIQSWLQCLVLLRPFVAVTNEESLSGPASTPSPGLSSQAVLSELAVAAASLYSAIPGILAIACRLVFFPSPSPSPPDGTEADPEQTQRQQPFGRILQAILVHQERPKTVESLVQVLLKNSSGGHRDCFIETPVAAERIGGGRSCADGDDAAAVETTIRLYPFGLAAAYDAPLTCVYSLLVSNPHALMQMRIQPGSSSSLSGQMDGNSS